jgi:hypothetical protein
MLTLILLVFGSLDDVTRYSGHCAQMVMPSYSTAKAIFAGFAIMRLAEKYAAPFHFADVSTVLLLGDGIGSWTIGFLYCLV